MGGFGSLKSNDCNLESALTNCLKLRVLEIVFDVWELDKNF